MILLVASCLGNWDKHQLGEPIGLSTDFTFLFVVAGLFRSEFNIEVNL